MKSLLILQKGMSEEEAEKDGEEDGNDNAADALCGGCLQFLWGKQNTAKVRPDSVIPIPPALALTETLVLPSASRIGKSVSRQSIMSGMSAGTFRSLVTAYVAMSPLYAPAAADYILQCVALIESQAMELMAEFEAAGRIGMLSQWQKEIVFQEDLVLPEQSFKSQVAFRNVLQPAWFRPGSSLS